MNISRNYLFTSIIFVKLLQVTTSGAGKAFGLLITFGVGSGSLLNQQDDMNVTLKYEYK